MNEWDFIKIDETVAVKLAEKIELSNKALDLLDDQLSPEGYMRLLMEQKLYVDAVLFLANALPKREATWWACKCARGGLKDSATEADITAIELAEAWVYQPTVEHCLPTMQAAEATKFHTPAGWAAVAAFWSGDSMSMVAGINTAPDDDLSGKAVNAAEAMAATMQEADKVDQYHQLFLKQGIDIACGGHGRVNDFTDEIY